MTEAPMAYVAHRLRGRIRLKVPQERGHRDYFDEVVLAVSELREVKRVRANATTASLVLEHSEPFDPIATFLAENRLLRLGGQEPRIPSLKDRVRREIGLLDLRIERATHGEADLASAAAVGLALLSVAQVMRGDIASPAITLALSAYSLLHRR